MQIKKPRIVKSHESLPVGTLKIDAMPTALEELFYIRHSHVHRSNPAAASQLKKFIAESKLKSVWVYYPWSHTAVHIPQEDTYFLLRTARNRNLIEQSEQSQYRNCIVGIAGLSVGSAIVASVVATGGPKTLKLADPDTIEITNLNRIRASLSDVGSNKTDVAARYVWELDPFADLYLWRKGIHRDDIEEFISGNPRLDIFVDEMDSIEMKFAARMACKKARIPVLMATDNGDGIIVDIERFDLEPSRPLFHGRVQMPKDLGAIDRKQFVQLSSKIIDPAYFTERQQRSILEIGTTLSGVAQLATAATTAGASIAYVIRQIANKVDLPSGRYVLSNEQLFIPDHNKAAARKRRAISTANFIKTLSSRV